MADSTNPAQDAMITAQLQEIARRTQDLITELTGQDCGFVLLVQPWAKGEDTAPRQMQHVSSFPRAFVQKSLGDLLKHWDQGVTHFSESNRG